MSEITLREHMSHCGKASSAKLTAQQRSERARRLSARRWDLWRAKQELRLPDVSQNGTCPEAGCPDVGQNGDEPAKSTK